MNHGEHGDSVSWLVVFAPLIGVVLLTGMGYLMGAIADWWRGR